MKRCECDPPEVTITKQETMVPSAGRCRTVMSMLTALTFGPKKKQIRWIGRCKCGQFYFATHTKREANDYNARLD